ncbi:MFS transporter [Rhizobacter sp. Root1221]|uniref:MFS transporter n=1 Tax=Rhizobacter sp. Root1221 TaxID=1736433 RepID=UPI0012F7E992|nr:MFS transporter [Rhizobacter sp. Root1221]
MSRIPAVRDGVGLNEGELGTALFALAAGAIVAFRLSARGADILGTRTQLLLAAALYSFALPQPALVGSHLALALTLFVFGAANGAVDITMNALGVEVERRAGRPVMSSLHGMWSAGGLAGAVLGSLAAHQGLSPAVHLTAVAVVLAVVLAVVRPLLPDVVQRDAAPAPVSKGRPDASMMALGAMALCAFLAEGAMADWSAVLLRDTLDTSEAVAAWGYAAFAVAMTTMRFVGDRATQRFSAVSVLRVGNAVGAVALAVALATRSLPVTLVAFGVAGLSLALVAPVVFATAGRRSRTTPGHGIATVASVGYAGFLLGPPVIGWVASFAGLSVSFGLLVVLLAALAVMAGQLKEH